MNVAGVTLQFNGYRKADDESRVFCADAMRFHLEFHFHGHF